MKFSKNNCLATFSTVYLLACSGCGVFPEKVSPNDSRLAPMFKAISEVDRSVLGFTAIDTNADFRLEISHRRNYDAMLHIYGKTSRTVSFRKTPNGYKWTGEQESHTGPKKYKTVDGTFNEEISITYETEKISGAPLNKISVQYFGEDSRLANRYDLTLGDVKPILVEWNTKK